MKDKILSLCTLGFIAICILAFAYVIISSKGDFAKSRRYTTLPPAMHSDGTPIHISEFRYQLPIGTLGAKLGDRLVIEGHYPIRPVMMGNPIFVEMIDGEKLSSPILISVIGLTDKFRIEQGIQYKLEGYESGRFGSVPMWIRPGGQQPFQYYPEFIVRQVLEENVIETSPSNE